MSVIVVRWLRHGKPVPEGWRIAEQRQSHHSAHALLIEQAERPDETSRNAQERL